MGKQKKATDKTCTKCGKPFTIKKGASKHVCVDTKKLRPYKCNACPKKTFKSSETLSKHTKSMHSDRRTEFVCKICSKSFATKNYLTVHERNHSNKRSYKCHLCPKGFNQPSTLKAHIMYHEGIRNFECKYCTKRYFTANTLRTHERRHTGERPYQCRYCANRFFETTVRRRHERIHTGERYQCEHCPMSFTHYPAVVRHTRMHQGLTVECKICGKVLAHSSLISHMRRMHIIEKRKCDFCNKLYNSKYINKHIKLVHMKTTIVKCRYCAKEFCNKESCYTHIRRIHNKDRKNNQIEEKEFECDYCHKAFPDKSYILLHIMRRHMNINCKFCSRIFSTTSALRLHELKGCETCSVCEKVFPSKLMKERHHVQYHKPNNKPKKYMCVHCSRQFQYKELRNKHIKLQHMNLKFTCDRCGLTVSNRKSITKHIWDVHMLCMFCNICSKRFKRDSEFRRHKRAGCKGTKCGSKL